MKILCIGDPHFKITNLPECDILITSILKLVKDILPEIIVIMGDILDTHERVHTICLNKAVSFIKELSQLSTVYILVGNHDMISHQEFLSENHWMYVLKNIDDKIIIVDKPCRLEYTFNKEQTKSANKKNDNNNKLNFIFCPYVSPGRFLEALNTKKLEKYIKNSQSDSFIFAHQEFFDCKFGIINSTIGDKWDESHCMVISGHIHNRDLLQKNIYYTGSPMQHAFGESHKKSICLLHIEDTFPSGKDNTYLHRENDSIDYNNLIEDLNIIKDKEDSYINTFYNNYKGKIVNDRLNIIEIELKLPRKHILYREIFTLNDLNDKLIKAKNDQEKISKIWRVILKGKNKIRENDKVRITITGNITEFKAFKKTKLYKEFLQRDIKIQFKYNVIQKDKENTEGIKNEIIGSKEKKRYKFLDILSNNINSKNDEELIEVYKTIFNE